MFFIEGCTSGYNRQVAVYDCVLLRENMGCSTATIYSGCTSGYNRECSSFTSGYYCIRQYILVVQLGTIEKLAVLQVSITAQKTWAVLQVGITA